MFELMPYMSRRAMYFNPFREIEEMSRSFWNDTSFDSFRTDITEKDGVYTLSAELPGFSKDDISIDLEKDILTIKAERSSESDDEEENRSYVRRERWYGAYSRSFNVKNIDTDAIRAAYNDGVLTLTMPKKAPEEPTARHLEIS